MVKNKENKIILLILLLLFIITVPSLSKAAKVSVGKVTGVKASSQTTSSVKVSWKKVSKATGYRLYVYNTSKKKYEYYGKTTKTSMTVKKLKSAQEYKIKIRGYRTVKKKNYYGSYSSVLNTTTKPSQVKSLKAKSYTDTTITLSWSKVTRATGYRVYLYNSKKKKYEYKGYSKTNSYTIKKLKAITQYKIKVRAYKTYKKKNYYGSYSSILTTSTGVTQVKSLKAKSQTDTTITLSWSKVSKATGYRVYVYNSKTKKYEYNGYSKTNSYTIKKLKAATEYKIKVRAYKTISKTNYYGSYSSILTTITKPSKVKGLTASKSTTSIKLSWTKISGSTGYRIYTYNTSTKKYEYTGYSNTNSYTVSKLKNMTEYKFKVRAYKTYNKTNYYGSYSDIYTTATIPNKVTGVTLTSKSTSSLELKWNKLSGVTGYDVYLYKQASQSFKSYKKVTGTSLNITNLDTAKFYKVYVKAYKTINGTNYYSSASTTVSQKTNSTDTIRAGIDVSKYQENIDWKAVKNSGIDFAMIRIGYRGYGSAGTLAEDPYFKKNIKGAIDNDIEVGVYFFSYAKNEKEAKEEANWVIKKLKEYNVTNEQCKFIAHDFETYNQERVKGVSQAQIDKNTIAFLQTVKNADYIPVLYGSKYYLTSKFDTENILSKVKECKIWLAQYNDTESYNGDYDIWQYSSTGLVKGITGNVDLNIVNFGRE